MRNMFSCQKKAVDFDLNMVNLSFKLAGEVLCNLNELILKQNTACWPTQRQRGMKRTSGWMSQICRQPLFEQLFLRQQILTVLNVCVAEGVLAVRVATVMVVDLARIRCLVLFDAELMVCGRTTERETEDDSFF